MKKFFSILLLLSTLLALPGFSAFAAEGEQKFEGESTYFTMTDNAGITTTKNDANGTGGSKWAWNPAIKKAQNVSGTLPYFRSGGIGATVDYVIQLDKAGNHDVYWAYRPKSESYSTVQVLVNGKEVGAPISQKSGATVNGTANVDNVVRKVLCGTAEFVKGKNTVTFMVVGDGPNTAFTVDYFSLAAPTGEPGKLPETIPPVEEGDPFQFEAESTPFTVTDSEGKTASVTGESKWAWSLKISGASLVSGDLAYFRSGGIGGTVDYTIDLDKAGQHSLVWAYRPNNESYSTVQVLVNGKEIGGEISLKSGRLVGGLMNGWLGNVRTVTLGNADFQKGKNTVSFKLVGPGKSDAASAFTIDYFKLGDPVDESKLTFTSDLEIPKVATKENSKPMTVAVPDGMLDSYPGIKAKPQTTDKVTVYPLAECYNASKQYKVTADGANVPISVMANNQYEFASFDYDPEKGPLTVTVECSAAIRSLVISPRHMEIDHQINGNTLTFTVTENYNYDLTINGKHLCISADPMQTDVPAESGEGIFNITQAPYSVNSQMTDRQVTEAIQQALDDASAYGSQKGNKNGVVYIPAGLYYVGNLVVSSNTFLYIAGGATLRITADTSLTKVHGNKTSMDTPAGGKGLDYTWWITTKTAETESGEAIGSYDIRIGGRGVLDGRDSEFWQLNNPGAFQYEVGNNTVIPIACSYFTLEGLTIREGICWSVIAVRSDHMTFEWLKMYQLIGYRQYEDDCIDICESQDVVVRNCIGYSRDDSFSTKTWPYKTGITINWAGVPEYLANVTFEDCLAYSKCFGYKVGQGSNQNQYDVTFRNCVTVDAARGMGVHLLSGEGTVENITFENCYIEKINSVTGTHCVWFYVYTQPNARGNGNAKNIVLKNVYVYKEAIGEKAIELRGHDAASGVDGVTFDHVYFDGKLAEAMRDLRPGINMNEFAKNVKVENSSETLPETQDPPATDPEDEPTPPVPDTPDTPDQSPAPSTPTDNTPGGDQNSPVNTILTVVFAIAGATALLLIFLFLLKKRK